MVETHAITPEQRDEALSRAVRVSPALATQHAQYFVDWVDAQVRKLVGQPTTDLIVETTLDLPIDTAAEAAARTVVARNAHLGVQQAAVVALDGSGRVRALIGGVSYADSQYDRATEARRQAGSAWKPFVYLTALENGFTPQSVVTDEPVTIDGWTPHNFEPEYLGPITLADALQRSVNTVAAKLADQVGRDKVADTARRLGITSEINTDPAMALGTSQVSPLEMAQAYDSFANGGYGVQAYAIERIRTRDGKVLYEHPAPAHDAVVPEPQLDQLVGMMRRVLVAPGTGVRAAIGGYDLAGKTGTTSDFRGRLVRGLHRRLRGRGLGRQGRRHPHAPRHRRLGACGPVAPVHGGEPAAAEGAVDPDGAGGACARGGRRQPRGRPARQHSGAEPGRARRRRRRRAGPGASGRWRPLRRPPGPLHHRAPPRRRHTEPASGRTADVLNRCVGWEDAIRTFLVEQRVAPSESPRRS